MKFLIPLALVFVVAGCEGFVGSPHGYIGTLNTTLFDVNGTPTIAPDGTSAMGFRRKDGSIEDAFSMLKTPNLTATGLPAIIAACLGADDVSECVDAALGN